MNFSLRLSDLENKYNILSHEVKDMKSDLTNLTNSMNIKLDTLTNMVGKLITDEKSEKNSPNQFADENGNLCNFKNPFYIESIKSQEAIKSEDKESNNININKHRKYKARDPLYYYYIMNGNEYKYTCRNKNLKYKLLFNCTDTHCKATGSYFKDSNRFIPGEEGHIDYEDHSYAITNIINMKFNKNEFREEDFIDKN